MIRAGRFLINSRGLKMYHIFSHELFVVDIHNLADRRYYDLSSFLVGRQDLWFNRELRLWDSHLLNLSIVSSSLPCVQALEMNQGRHYDIR